MCCFRLVKTNFHLFYFTFQKRFVHTNCMPFLRGFCSNCMPLICVKMHSSNLNNRRREILVKDKCISSLMMEFKNNEINKI